MRTENLKFPLHSEQTIRLPKGCRITGVTVKDDITFLVIENPNDFALDRVRSDAVGNFFLTSLTSNGMFKRPVETKDHKLRVAMENEWHYGRDAEGKETKTHIPVPEESDKLRLIASFETVTIAAKWHLFEEL